MPTPPESLYLQNNFITGSIPSALGQIKGLETLDLSRNNLSGPIPKFLGDLTLLYSLNLPFNNFFGEVPTVGVFANASGVSVKGNGKLCNGITGIHLPPCSIQRPKKKTKTCDCAHCYFSCCNTGYPFITLHSYILAQEKQNKSPINNNHARPPIDLVLPVCESNR